MLYQIYICVNKGIELLEGNSTFSIFTKHCNSIIMFIIETGCFVLKVTVIMTQMCNCIKVTCILRTL